MSLTILNHLQEIPDFIRVTDTFLKAVSNGDYLPDNKGSYELLISMRNNSILLSIKMYSSMFDAYVSTDLQGQMAAQFAHKHQYLLDLENFRREILDAINHNVNGINLDVKHMYPEFHGTLKNSSLLENSSHQTAINKLGVFRGSCNNYARAFDTRISNNPEVRQAWENFKNSH